MDAKMMIKLAKYLANRLNFKLTSHTANIYIYYTKQKDMELDIEKEHLLHLFIYDSQKISNIYYNMFAVKYLAEKLGYDN
jgi:hypothetical protein